jgi:hypothetical protein
MSRVLILFLAVFFAAPPIQAQSVLNAAGRTINPPGTGIVLEYAVGEVAVTTLGVAFGALTQGVLQPYLRVVNTKETFDEKFDFKVYPNPTSDFLTVQTNYIHFTFVEVASADGRVVQIGPFDYSPIDCSMLQAGAYFVRLYSNNHIESKTFKIIKQ